MIKINDVTFDAVVTTGTDGSMSFEFNPSGMTLTEIEELFSSGVEIELIENGYTVAKYYNKELRSLNINKKPSKIKVVLVTSPMSGSVEQELREMTELQGDAIGDLANTVSNMNDDAEISAEAFEELAGLVADLIERVGILEATEDGASSGEENEV